MKPEEFNELKRQVEELNQKLELLANSSDIPNNVEQAFRTRFKLDTYNPISVSSKLANSETQAVNEAGSASYGVLKAPDEFLEITLSGTIKYIPIFT